HLGSMTPRPVRSARGFFQAEDGIRDFHVTGVHTCALPILKVTRTYPCTVPTLPKQIYPIVFIGFLNKSSKSSGIPEPGRSRTMCIENAHEQKRPGQNEYRFQSA